MLRSAFTRHLAQGEGSGHPVNRYNLFISIFLSTCPVSIYLSIWYMSIMHHYTTVGLIFQSCYLFIKLSFFLSMYIFHPIGSETSPWPGLSVCRFVYWSFCPNFLKGLGSFTSTQTTRVFILQCHKSFTVFFFIQLKKILLKDEYFVL